MDNINMFPYGPSAQFEINRIHVNYIQQLGSMILIAKDCMKNKYIKQKIVLSKLHKNKYKNKKNKRGTIENLIKHKARERNMKIKIIKV